MLDEGLCESRAFKEYPLTSQVLSVGMDTFPANRLSELPFFIYVVL